MGMGAGETTLRDRAAEPLASDALPASGTKRRVLPSTIQRFQKSEIKLHWAIAVPFLICYVSALILFVFYNVVPLRPYRFIFSWIHRISGVCFVVLPLLVVVTNRGSWNLFFHNIKEAWVWGIADVKWLLRSGMAALHRKVSLPEQGKFNAGEKLNFMMVTATYSIFVVTGILIWLPGVSFYAWLVHFISALVATPFLIGHIYMATVNPSTRKGLPGMISGRVDGAWAKHHYTRWYRECFEDDEAADGSEEPPQTKAVRTAFREGAEKVLADRPDVAVLDSGVVGVHEAPDSRARRIPVSPRPLAAPGRERTRAGEAEGRS